MVSFGACFNKLLKNLVKLKRLQSGAPPEKLTNHKFKNNLTINCVDKNREVNNAASFYTVRALSGGTDEIKNK